MESIGLEGIYRLRKIVRVKIANFLQSHQKWSLKREGAGF